MINLPDGFDYIQLWSDFMLVATPFVTIMVVILGYEIIKKALERGGR